MILQHRPLLAWPGEMTKYRKPSPFDAGWMPTLSLLERELTHLGARSPVVLQVAVDEGQVRLDGQLRADARPRHPGVILNFESKRLGSVAIPCDAFEERYYRSKLSGWQSNVRAIGLGLEALRKVERYGIAPRGEQYTGWKALPSGIALGAGQMSVDEAARLLCEATMEEVGEDPSDVSRVRTMANSLWKEAAKRHHPDVGGNPELFRRLTEARDLLVRAS